MMFDSGLSRGRIVKQFVSALIFAVIISTPSYSQSCDDDSIKSVSNDGSIIVMISGAVYKVDAVDQVDTALWLAADDVLICNGDSEIINPDENGERATVHRLR
jgi:hypothetical protein